MPASRARILALALGVGLSGLVIAIAWLARAGSRAADRERLLRTERLLAERAAQGSAPPVRDPAQAGRAYAAPDLWPWHLTEELASSLFFQRGSTETYDPWSYFRHRGSLQRRIEWLEHPRGAWTWRTNAQGLREDADVDPAFAGRRVIVTGDSHTEGFCDNVESLAGRLESLLAAEGGEVDVLNAANGGFSFFHYAGVLERFLHLRPEAFVVVVFGGNDFLEAAVPAAYFRGETLPMPGPEEIEELRAWHGTFGPGLTQSFHSLDFFRRRPEQVEACLRAAGERTLSIRDRCAAAGVRLLVLYLPPPCDAGWREQAVRFDELARALRLAPADRQVVERLADRYLEVLREAGIEAVDLRPRLREGPGPWYWERDHHLNLAGHDALARIVHERLR